MKYLTPPILLVIVFAVVGCAHQRPRQMTVICPAAAGTTLSSNEIETLRSGEIVKKYYVGSYVDPSRPDVRHDPHMIERIEQRSRWNLRPNVPVVASGPTYKAVSENALKNDMQQQYDHEMQQQRLASTQAQTQVDELKREVDSLKATLQQQNENGLKQIEEKIESLYEKMKTLENSKQQATVNVNPSAQLNNQHVSQVSKSWEVPIQAD